MDAWVRQLAETFNGPVRLLDARGRQWCANQAWSDLMGSHAESPEGWRNLVPHKEDLDRFDSQVSCRLDDGHPGPGGRLWIRLASESAPDVERWWMLTCTQVCDDAGVELGCITTLAPADDGSADRQRRVLDEAQALAHMGAWELDVPSGELWWSDEVYRIFGLPPQSFTPDYDAFLAAVHPDDRSTVRDAVDRVLVAGSQYAVRHRIVRPNGDVRYVQEKSLVVRESDGSARRLLGTVTDVTEEALADAAQEQAQAALASSEARYRMLAENASDVVWQIDRDGVVEWLSDSVRTVLGWQPADIVGHQADEFLHPEDRGRRGDLSQSLAGDKGPQEVRLLRPDGTYRWMSSSVHPTETSEGLALVGALRDIQAEVEARVELEHAIGHDRLTGLATLAATAGRIADRQARLAHGSAVVGVMCIGVDGLGTINDAYAHAAGDRVLAAVARRIVATVGDVDLVGRGAGNEVHVVLPDLASGADAVPLAERIRRAVVDPIHVGEVAVTPSVSIGIAVGGRDDDAGELLRGAGVAMRRAKSNGRDRYEFLDQEMADEAQRLLQLESGIRVGLQRDEFRPWFQPIVNLTTGEVVGHEALVRWLTADGQTVEAWKFLPVAERGHLIADLDLVVLNKAIEELAGDPDSGRFIAVNVSAESLRRGDYDAHVVRALTEWGVPSERLHLEVTETALLNLTGDLRATVATLADAGISWYVDDFGTGYSSISHLRDLPIGGLKLDRSFTSGLAAGDQTCTRLADGLVGLADGLGLDTVAEGVETAAGQAVLASQGWRHGQGWLYGKPAPRR